MPSDRQNVHSKNLIRMYIDGVMKTILVPVDFSPATTRVCDAAYALAKLINARLIFFHAVQPPPAMMNDYYAFDTGQMVEVMAATEKASLKRLRQLSEKYSEKDQPAQAVQTTGSPVATILEKAASTKADYIVIGSHGHTAMYDLIVGGTTHGVLRKTPCPVLVVPMTEPKSGQKRR